VGPRSDHGFHFLASHDAEESSPSGTPRATPANDTARGYDLTLIEAEVLDSLTLPEGTRLSYAEARRNVVTRGIDLNALVGRRFRVGNVECLGQRLCEPCSHLEHLTTKGILRGLIHRGGLRADVLNDGIVAIGDLVETIDEGNSIEDGCPVMRGGKVVNLSA
jgi:MOSC domain-containing protein YiiM